MNRFDAPILLLPAVPRPRWCARALHILVAAGVAALSVTVTTPAAVQSFVGLVPTVSNISFDGGAEVDLSVIPLTVGVRGSRASIRAMFPYLDVSARTSPYRIGGPIIGVTVPEQQYDEQGPGDIVLTPNLVLVEGDSDSTWFWGSARIKLPTADEDKYLGTGEPDYAPGLGFLAPIGSRLAALGTARYNFRGDPPDRVIENTISATAAAVVRVGNMDGLTVGVSRTDTSFEGGDPTNAFTTSWFHPFTNGTALSLSGLVGLASEARVYGIALGFTYNDGPFDWGN